MLETFNLWLEQFIFLCHKLPSSQKLFKLNFEKSLFFTKFVMVFINSSSVNLYYKALRYLYIQGYPQSHFRDD